MKSIEQAKEFLYNNFEKGTTCPCCNKNVKLYKVKLTAGMVSVLIKFYKAREKGWIHPIKDFKTVNGDYAKLRHWGFLEKNNFNNDPTIKASGLWMITNVGISFIKGETYVPQKVMLYNNKFYGFDGDTVGVKEALGTKFNFEELMAE
jgi:hypothetical protein